MGNPFFEHPILNSPYEYPRRHWELDPSGQPTQQIIDSRRPADFVTPIPKPRRQQGQGQQGDPLNLIVEIKGYRGEDAGEKASTMRTYWVPGVNNLKDHGRWAFAEFTDVWAMQEDFAKVVASGFDTMVETVTQSSEKEFTA